MQALSVYSDTKKAGIKLLQYMFLSSKIVFKKERRAHHNVASAFSVHITYYALKMQIP